MLSREAWLAAGTHRHDAADVGAGSDMAALHAAMQTARQRLVAGAAAGGRRVLAAQPLRDRLQQNTSKLASSDYRCT